MLRMAIIDLIFNLGLSTGQSLCLLPLIPLYIAYFANKERHVGKGFLTSILVLLGIMSVVMIFGIITNVITIELLRFLSNNFRQFQLLLGILFVLLGGLLLANISLNLDRLELLSDSSKQRLQRFQNPYISSYLIGVFYGVIVIPCALISFLTINTIVAAEIPLNALFLVIIFFIGISLPFFLIVNVFFALIYVLTYPPDSVRATQINQYLPRVAGGLVIVMGIFLIL